MSQPWKLLPMAVLAAVALALGGFFAGDQSARAEVDSVNIEDIEAGDNTSTEVEVISEDDSGDLIIEISGGSDIEIDDFSCTRCDDDDVVISGRTITIDTDALDTDDDADDTVLTAFTLTLDCEDGDDILITADDDDGGDFAIATCEDSATATPTATATTTAGPAATVTTSASPGTISCSGTSIVTIQVRDADGDPVPPGTAVTISTTLGSVSPSSGQTTDASGNAFVFLTAPANQGGQAVVTAESGEAEGSANVTINCGATPTPTTAPPPTVAPGGGGGVISPPNTGSAGLADSDSQGWVAFAALGLLVAAATIGIAGIAKVRS